MSSVDLFANNASTTLTVAVVTTPAAGTSETWTVASTAAPLPQVVAGQQYRVTVGPATDLSPEIVWVTAVLSGTTVTVLRGQEASTVKAHAIGDAFTHTVTAGALTALQAFPPLWSSVAASAITVPRTQGADSKDYGGTPVSGTVHYTYFIPQASFTVGHLLAQTGGNAQAGYTYSNVGLYTVNTSTGALTRVAQGASQALFTYGSPTWTLSPSFALIAGTVYAVGLLQVATTPNSLLGMWYLGYFSAPSLSLLGGTGLSTLPASAAAPSGVTNFAFYYQLYA